MADINSLPHEVLVRIFQFYLQTESQLNFLNCVSNVCRKWKEVSKNSCYFKTLDGSLSLPALVTLAKAGSLRMTRTLKFDKVKKEKSDQYKCIYSNMPRLKHINLTNMREEIVDKVREHPVFTELEGHCPEFCELVLGHPDVQTCISNFMGIAFEKFMKIRGPNLVTLDFSSVNLWKKSKIFVLIADNCPNLEELMAQNLKVKGCFTHRFPTERMQKGCPKLKTLRLGFPITICKKSRKYAIGFPDLEIFTHPSNYNYYFRSADLDVLLSQSPNLKILDIRGCVQVSFKTVYSLQATDLEQIYLSFMTTLTNTDIIKVVRKWSHSLNILDVSHVEGEAINEIFTTKHLPNGLPNLEVLYVNNTSITAETLKPIIQQFPKIRYLNLESCHGLISGTRKIYRSRSEIEKLLLKFEETEMDCI